MPRTFTGDYSTGDFSQWEVQRASGANPGSYGWPQYRLLAPQYANQIVKEDTDCGYAARFEIRTGDGLAFEASSGVTQNERAEVAANTSAINVTRWEAFSIKFDTTYPLAVEEGWVVTNQWPDASGLGWAFSEYHLDGVTPSGMWSLNYFGGVDRNIRLLDVPMNRGNWIDVKMHIGWYANSSGFVKVWINGERQMLRYGSWDAPRLVAPALSPSDTFTGQTVWNNTSGTFYYKEGLYRAGPAWHTANSSPGFSYPDGIVYHANYRTSTDEGGL